MKNFLLAFTILSSLPVSAQNDRVTDHNGITWLQTFGTIKINKHFDWLAESQWRITDRFKSNQQLLVRTAIQYRLNNQASVAVGYAWIKTYAYGDFPIAANGPFPERRIHQQIALRQSLKQLAITQRLRTEQRWIGRVMPGDPRKIEDWVFTNRFRYQLRLQRQLTDSSQVPLYAAIANEIFVNAGKNVGANIFDQNRIQLLFGVKLSPQFSVEAGYIKQTLLQGRRTTSNKTVIQNNDGATFSLLVQM